jgi:guanylate kinase
MKRTAEAYCRRDFQERDRGRMMKPRKHDPIIFLFSAPSGTGKGTIVSALLRRDPTLTRIVTVTSRPKRQTEVEGESYYFLPESEFRNLIATGDFVEWNEIYGHLYGTKKDIVQRFVEEAARDGRDLLLEIDVDGKRNFARYYSNLVSIFLLPPSDVELERRIRGRNADEAEQIRKRLARSDMEMKRVDEYDHFVVNDSKDIAVEKIQEIISRERAARR